MLYEMKLLNSLFMESKQQKDECVESCKLNSHTASDFD